MQLIIINQSPSAMRGIFKKKKMLATWRSYLSFPENLILIKSIFEFEFLQSIHFSFINSTMTKKLFLHT